MSYLASKIPNSVVQVLHTPTSCPTFSTSVTPTTPPATSIWTTISMRCVCSGIRSFRCRTERCLQHCKRVQRRWGPYGMYGFSVTRYHDPHTPYRVFLQTYWPNVDSCDRALANDDVMNDLNGDVKTFTDPEVGPSFAAMWPPSQPEGIPLRVSDDCLTCPDGAEPWLLPCSGSRHPPNVLPDSRQCPVVRCKCCCRGRMVPRGRRASHCI